MTKRRSRSFSPLLGLAAALALAACGHEDEAPGGDAAAGPLARIELTAQAYRTAGIEITTVGRHPVERTLRVTAGLDYDEGRVSRVTAPFRGRIAGLPAGLGDPVEAGAVLAEMTSEDLARAASDLRGAAVEADLRAKEAERARSLFEGKAISRGELLRREAEHQRALAAVAEGRQQLALLGLAETDIDRLAATNAEAAAAGGRGAVRSPLAGRVVERSVTRGQSVEPGEEMFVVADLRRLWLILRIFEKDLPFIETGMQVDIETTAYPDQPFQGEIDYIGDVVDPHSRTVTARVVVENSSGRLKAGMYADAVIRIAEKSAGVTVPAAAVVRIDGRTEVFVETGVRRFERRPVEVGRATDEWVEVLSGLTEGERVAEKGTFILKSEALKGSLGEEE